MIEVSSIDGGASVAEGHTGVLETLKVSEVLCGRAVAMWVDRVQEVEAE